MNRFFWMAVDAALITAVLGLIIYACAIGMAYASS